MGKTPTRYEIKREGYTLTLIVHPTQMEPLVAIRIDPRPEHRIGFQNQADRVPGRCIKWVNYGQSIWWTYSFHHCNDPAPWQEIDNHLRFTVFDQHGTVVVEEAIPYTVKRDGFYGYFDAI